MCHDRSPPFQDGARKDAPPGPGTDGKGNVIPFEKRTKDDQEKVMGNSVPQDPRNAF